MSNYGISETWRTCIIKLFNVIYLIMNLIKKAGTRTMADYKLNYVDDGKIYILGEFDETISQNVVPEFTKLIAAKKDQKNAEINIYINSHGGYENELLALQALCDLARKEGIKIVTYVLGIAYSCGSLLAVYGDKRYMYKDAMNLMHLGETTKTVKTPLQLERINKFVNEFFERTIQTYKKCTKMPEKEIRKRLEDDKYFLNAQECLKYGLCDEIIGEKEITENCKR